MSSHLLDTAIGGAIALGGTIVAQWFGLFSSKVERQHKHAALQRERLERISNCVGEGILWSQSILTLSSFDSVRDKQLPMEVRQAVMLCQIYFPDLVSVAKEYIHSLIDYHLFAIGSFRKDAPPGATIGAQMFLNPKAKEYEQNQFSLRNKFDEAIAQEARKYEPSA